MGIRKYKPTTPGPSWLQRRRLRRGHALHAGEVARPSADQVAVAATTTAASPPVTSVVATSAPTASSTSVATTRTACRPRSLTSSTTPTARRASRCCTTPTARSATSWPPRAWSRATPIENGPGADIKPGNSLPLRNIPTGTVIHAVELKPGGGAKIARSAGVRVQLVAKDGPYAQLRMPSGEIRNVDVRCRATVGEVGNAEQSQHQLGQGRPHALEGQAPDRPWCRHEPGRPPARWWRGQDVRWTSPGQPRGVRPRAAPAAPASRATS